MFDLHLDLQPARHTGVARLARRLLYAMTVRDGCYPITFEAAGPAEAVLQRGSENLYVHIPFCRSICAYCPYLKMRYRHSVYDAYQRAVLDEIDQYLREAEVPAIASLYFGGGTPSMTPELVEAVIERVRPHAAPGCEIGIEVHPWDANAQRMAMFRRYGVDRVSLGIESLDDATLRTLDRPYTAVEAEQAIVTARAAGFACVDVNLIYGIPDQAAARAALDATRCIELGVDHLSAYPLITFEHTAMGRRARRGSVATYGLRQREVAQRSIAQQCLRRGLQRTSVWSYGRPGARYTTVTRDDYRGFGAGAGSKVGGTFWFNSFSVAAYSAPGGNRPAIVMRPTERFQQFHWFYWQIYKGSVDEVAYQGRFSRELGRDFGLIIGALNGLGWLRRVEGGWRLTERGAMQAHKLQMLFSLTFIDDLWSRCQREPWPSRIELY